MSGRARIFFTCRKCKRRQYISIVLEEPNFMGDTAEEQTRYAEYEINCRYCSNEFILSIANDVDGVYPEPCSQMEDVRTERPVYECFCDDEEFDQYCEILYKDASIDQYVSDFLEYIRLGFEKYIQVCRENSVKLCSAELDFRPNSPRSIDYSKVEIQQYYFLRYFYAYFLQYHYLYKKVSLDDLNVLSVGCGPYTDLAALRYARKKSRIEYCGIDPIDWPNEYKIRMQGETNVIFHQGFLVDSLASQSIDKYNVFIFPKSMEYLKENNGVNQLVEKIYETDFTEGIIYLILNGMDKNFSEDQESFERIKNAFYQKGFVDTEKYEKKTSTDLEERFSDMPEKVKPPISWKWYKALSENCFNKQKCEKASKCPMDWCAITKTANFNFMIYKLERK